MPRAVKPSRARVQQDVQLLIRTFPSVYVQITRASRTYGGRFGAQTVGSDPVVYQGEALVIPAGASVNLYGLGQVESKNHQVLIAGHRDVQQGDLLTWEGKRYQVSQAPDPWRAFTLVTLQLFEQAAR